ncbi:MAG: F0F1 ATP synthase subunit delta [Candidatus Dormibacteria bacterium]
MPELAPVPSSARHYAEAIFELAEEEGGFAEWSRRLERLLELCQQTELGAALANQGLSSLQKLELARAVLDAQPSLDRPARNLLLLLVSGRRPGLLAAIARGYQELVDEREGRVLARLTTAVALAAGERRRLAGRLARRLGREVRFETEVDPALLGGAVVRVGDRVFDASLRTRLLQLRQEIVSQTATG